MQLILAYISSFSILLPILSSSIKFKAIWHRFPFFVTLLGISLITEIFAITVAIKHKVNVPVINIFTVFEFIFLAIFYKRFFDQFEKLRIHYWIIVLFIGVAAVDAFYINTIDTMNNLASSVEFLVLIGYASFAFFTIIKNLIYENIMQEPFFWINTAILIYFGGNLFLFLFSNYLQKNDIKDFGTLYSIHSILNIIYYFLISVGFWKVQRI